MIWNYLQKVSEMLYFSLVKKSSEVLCPMCPPPWLSFFNIASHKVWCIVILIRISISPLPTHTIISNTYLLPSQPKLLYSSIHTIISFAAIVLRWWFTRITTITNRRVVETVPSSSVVVILSSLNSLKNFWKLHNWKFKCGHE